MPFRRISTSQRAEKNIDCWKIVRRRGDGFKSAFYDLQYKIGQWIYPTTIIETSELDGLDFINGGVIHSFSTKAAALMYFGLRTKSARPAIVHCVIPAGETYWVNEDDETYASKSLIIGDVEDIEYSETEIEHTAYAILSKNDLGEYQFEYPIKDYAWARAKRGGKFKNVVLEQRMLLYKALDFKGIDLLRNRTDDPFSLIERELDGLVFAEFKIPQYSRCIYWNDREGLVQYKECELVYIIPANEAVKLSLTTFNVNYFDDIKI